MEGKFAQISDEYEVFKEEYQQLGKEELLTRAQALLEKMRESGRVIIDPEQRSIISSFARDLGDIIFDNSGKYPYVRLAYPSAPVRLLPDLYIQCRTVLSQCREFQNYRGLRAVFVTDQLFPFRIKLPSADNPRELADMVMEYLLDKRLPSGRPVFLVFLATLRDRYQPGDALRNDLEALYYAVQSAMAQTEPRPAQPPNRKSALFELLSDSDYREIAEEIAEEMKEPNERLPDSLRSNSQAARSSVIKEWLIARSSGTLDEIIAGLIMASILYVFGVFSGVLEGTPVDWLADSSSISYLVASIALIGVALIAYVAWQRKRR